jgi:hypothetical protein
MAANTNPIYALTPNMGLATGINTANATADITSGTSYLVFTAGSNGAWVKDVVVKANPGTNTAATALRLWLNNGGATGTAANTTLIREVAATATTASTTAAQSDFTIVVNRALPAGYKLYLTIGAYTAGAFTATAFGGDY